MKTRTLGLVCAAMMLGAAIANAAMIADTVEYPQPEFVNPANPLANYRYANQDWGWTHGAIAGTPTTATLSIGAYDVDYSQGERDMISAYRVSTASWVNLGYLAGGNNIWQFTTFNLDSSWHTSIQAGLQVFIDIDQNNGGWAVALSKSVVSVDGADIGNPDPTVPEPSTYFAGALLALVFGAHGFRSLRSRKQTA